eukprot:CAMPEP_0202694900 /NCGR_PEP_ID=MMETSP1385-20130828/8632_1 /ASSEMBLY_ACC=CAM_ASM_000861 /TAXON_ID=933848 /ORGANISM="Elphidium margaritaceum" /LENGTH=380 /DNA_ID=CAMNT_0049350833 /DNA_START=95 /DNA_END=1237 /DNA_ORIENTATION=-
MKYMQTSTTEEFADEERVLAETRSPRVIGSNTPKTILIAIAVCLVVLVTAITILLFVFVVDHSSTSGRDPTKTQDLVDVMMEQPTECLLDETCTSFAFTELELSRIRSVFNAYDGDDDSFWSKQEFVQFYIESIDGGSRYDVFGVMDLNGDKVWSYKEAVIYMSLMGELQSVHEVIPAVAGVIREVYNYNSTGYASGDQLFWEYAAELMFSEFDEFQQGFVTRENYLSRLAELEFDMFAHSDATHSSISFDEFVNSRLSDDALRSYVNTDLSALSAEYSILSASLQNSTHVLSLLSQLELKHCLYGTVDFPSIRRRLATSKWDCIVAAAGCTGAAVATVAGCIAGSATGVGIVGCAGGAVATSAGCYGAVRVCEAYLNGE